MKKYSNSFERDWKFYNSVSHIFDFAGKTIPDVVYSSDGKSAKDCFYNYDTHGKLIPTTEPELLLKILTTKASINLHIKMWAEGKLDGTFNSFDLEELNTQYNFPSWIKEAIYNQFFKLILKNTNGN